ncbi:hypothetical protein QO010_001361 [Caulobacter ginsengisoli]|uniref:Uncharacterized protein n=1 Tax=Caulobacter ginsengisoli TaxID=400775 RepID=A0ABU0IQC0_9CAUL|nr:hypothetical protein [Caulobacter ginsengisoli]MDQ0463590.1 hypothetical protein [Caulobacter ginsengisoli]
MKFSIRRSFVAAASAVRGGWPSTLIPIIAGLAFGVLSYYLSVFMEFKVLRNSTALSIAQISTYLCSFLIVFFSFCTLGFRRVLALSGSEKKEIGITINSIVVGVVYASMGPGLASILSVLSPLLGEAVGDGQWWSPHRWLLPVILIWPVVFSSAFAFAIPISLHQRSGLAQSFLSAFTVGKGNRVRIFILFLIVATLGAALATIFGTLAEIVSPRRYSVSYAVVLQFGVVAATAIAAIISVIAYLELKSAEGGDANGVAKAFS